MAAVAGTMEEDFNNQLTQADFEWMKHGIIEVEQGEIHALLEVTGTSNNGRLVIIGRILERGIFMEGGKRAHVASRVEEILRNTKGCGGSNRFEVTDRSKRSITICHVEELEDELTIHSRDFARSHDDFAPFFLPRGEWK